MLRSGVRALTSVGVRSMVCTCVCAHAHGRPPDPAAPLTPVPAAPSATTGRFASSSRYVLFTLCRKECHLKSCALVPTVPLISLNLTIPDPSHRRKHTVFVPLSLCSMSSRFLRAVTRGSFQAVSTTSPERARHCVGSFQLLVRVWALSAFWLL